MRAIASIAYFAGLMFVGLMIFVGFPLTMLVYGLVVGE